MDMRRPRWPAGRPTSPDVGTIVAALAAAGGAAMAIDSSSAVSRIVWSCFAANFTWRAVRLRP